MATKQTQPQPVQPQHTGNGTVVWQATVGSQPVTLAHLFGRRYAAYSNGKFYGYMLARSPSHAVNRVAVAAGWAEFCASLQTTNTYAARMAARKAARAAGQAKASKGSKASKAAAQATAPKAKPARKAKAPKAPTLAALLA